MADPAEVAIESALLTHAQLYASSQSPAIAIDLPNIVFNPPEVGQTAKWLRASFMPAPTATLTVANGSNQHYGLMQISVFCGQGAGELAPARIASEIIAFFKRGTVLTKDGFTARVWKAPYRGSLMKDDPWMMLPVSIPYICFAPDPA